MLNKSLIKKSVVSLSILLTATGVTSTVLASEREGVIVLEEVIVTAQKRSESIQDIPFAITALSQDTLDKAGISSLEEFAYKVPGLAISGESNGRTQINIRGISSGEIRRDNTRASETVGIYFDEIPLSTALYNPDLEPFDLERVEVLRGPQGTLYGSGSLAGTIRLVSKAPLMNEFEGLIDTGFTSVNHGAEGYSMKGVVNLPITEDMLAARIVAYQVEKAGWIDNLSDGPGAGDDVNKNNKWGIRTSLLWTPTERLTIRPGYIHQVIDSDGTSADNVEAVGVQRLVNVGTLTAAQAFDPSGEYEQWKYHGESYDDEVSITNLHLQYDLDNIQVTSSSSYIDRDIRVFIDVSSNNVAGGLFPAPPAATGGSIRVLGIGLDDNKTIKSIAQEIRLSSTTDSELQWMVGFYYSDIDVDYHQFIIVTDPAGIVGVPPSPLVSALYSGYDETPGILLRTIEDLGTRQIAGFGEASYRFFDKWQATVGLRYFDVKQNYTNAITGRLNGAETSFTRVTKDDGINPKFLLSYEASEDILISAQAAKGFRLGGPQLFVPTVATASFDCPGELAGLGVSFDPTGFKSESLWNYELAIKSAWMDGRAQFNASAFYIDYSDLQITTRLKCGFSFTDNAQGATSKGVEFEIQALATDNLKLSVGGSYTDTKLTSDLSSGEAVKGDELIYVPNAKLNANVNYTRPLTDTLTGYLNFSYQYTGTVEQFYPNGTNLPITRSRTADAYQTGNLRIGVEAEKWEVALFVNNLWDEYGVSYVDSINPGGPGGWVTDASIRPRTIGLNAKYRF